MAENTKIEWADHTVNLWWGCSKVNAGCKNCYAEALANRFGGGIWGEKAKRKLIKSAFKDLRKYQKQAKEAGTKYRIFCGSMMDIFEDSKFLINHEPQAETEWLRRKLFMEIEKGDYPNLIFLFLTKRPENINYMIPEKWHLLGVPRNVWFGLSLANQQITDEKLPFFADAVINAKKFLSIEPQVGPINILSHIWPQFSPIRWVIQGGESGAKKRPFNLDWAYSMKDQCEEAGIPYFFKQIDKVQRIPMALQIRELPKF